MYMNCGVKYLVYTSRIVEKFCIACTHSLLVSVLCINCDDEAVALLVLFLIFSSMHCHD